MKNLITIKCPVCGQEYMPGEVFLPESFFGRQTEIIRKPDGVIDFYVGDDMDLDEEFYCEGCGTKLAIHANLSFNVEPQVEENFDDEYTTEINKPAKLKLEEKDIFSD